MVRNAVHWFRKGLRLHDNPALQRALSGADTVRCVYILDPCFAGSSNIRINWWRFLIQSLEDLDISLRKLKSRLFVVRGQPMDVFPRLFKEWNVTHLTFEYDSEPFGKERDAAIMKLAKIAGVEVIVQISHTLYDVDRIIKANGNRSPITYKRFCAIIRKLKLPKAPVNTVTLDQMEKCTQNMQESQEEQYGVPSLEELGFDTSELGCAVWHGGETKALAWLHKYFEGKDHNKSPLPLYEELLRREFFYTAATNNPRFDRMEGNPVCVQIPWDKNQQALTKWADGQTGFPWIDAIMKQLRQEGWIHHLARRAVGCFLTRSDLWISWEEGMKVFNELLLDADFSVSAGWWMWLSCSAFFQRFLPCYCPVGFGRRTDPNGDYVRQYLPILRGYPTKYIHDPWNAPVEVQAAAKCIIGVHYPRPMVNHIEAIRLNTERMKQIYQQLSHDKGLCLPVMTLSLTDNQKSSVAKSDGHGKETGSCSANHDKTPNVFGKRGKPENAVNRDEIKQIKIPRLQTPEDVSRIKAEPMMTED